MRLCLALLWPRLMVEPSDDPADREETSVIFIHKGARASGLAHAHPHCASRVGTGPPNAPDKINARRALCES